MNNNKNNNNIMALLHTMDGSQLYMLTLRNKELLNWSSVEWDVSEFKRTHKVECKICKMRFKSSNDYERHYMFDHQKDMLSIVDDFFSMNGPLTSTKKQ